MGFISLNLHVTKLVPCTQAGQHRAVSKAGKVTIQYAGCRAIILLVSVLIWLGLVLRLGSVSREFFSSDLVRTLPDLSFCFTQDPAVRLLHLPLVLQSQLLPLCF